VRFCNAEPVDTFCTLINPGRPIPPEASAVNGITDDMVADQPGLF
jgi:DNA polymerase III epsilon subunit-like protein